MIPCSPPMTRVSRNSSANNGQNDGNIECPRKRVEDISESFDYNLTQALWSLYGEELTWTRTIKRGESRFIVQICDKNKNGNLARRWKSERKSISFDNATSTLREHEDFVFLSHLPETLTRLQFSKSFFSLNALLLRKGRRLEPRLQIRVRPGQENRRLTMRRRYIGIHLCHSIHSPVSEIGDIHSSCTKASHRRFGLFGADSVGTSRRTP